MCMLLVNCKVKVGCVASCGSVTYGCKYLVSNLMVSKNYCTVVQNSYHCNKEYDHICQTFLKFVKVL